MNINQKDQISDKNIPLASSLKNKLKNSKYDPHEFMYKELSETLDYMDMVERK